jgi:hypothetical protein
MTTPPIPAGAERDTLVAGITELVKAAQKWDSREQQAARAKIVQAFDAVECDAARWRYLRQFIVVTRWKLTNYSTLSVFEYKVPGYPDVDATVEQIVDAGRLAVSPSDNAVRDESAALSYSAAASFLLTEANASVVPPSVAMLPPGAVCQRRFGEGCSAMILSGYGDAHECDLPHGHLGPCVCSCSPSSTKTDKGNLNDA